MLRCCRIERQGTRKENEMRMLSLWVLVLSVAGCAWSADQESPWANVFTDGLEDAQGQKVSLDQLKGKIVGVYFSAHWCPPCRAFTPKLVEFRDKNKEKFEVVFVSSDKSAKEKQGYMTEVKMLWPSVPWQAASGKALAKQYDVKGIPMLVILSPDGKLISANGRGEVTSSPDTALATWEKAAK
jgi:thiol-disulfide isomerase/thioredoxin